MCDLILARDYIKQHNENKPKAEQIKVLTLEKLQELEGENEELDYTRNEPVDEDGDFKILRVYYTNEKDEDGEYYYGENSISDCVVVMYKDEVLAWAGDFEDQDYYETMGYFCGIVDGFKRSQELIEWIKKETIDCLTAVDDSNEADTQYYIEGVAEKLGIDVESLERKEIDDEE